MGDSRTDRLFVTARQSEVRFFIHSGAAVSVVLSSPHDCKSEQHVLPLQVVARLFQLTWRSRLPGVLDFAVLSEGLNIK